MPISWVLYQWIDPGLQNQLAGRSTVRILYCLGDPSFVQDSVDDVCSKSYVERLIFGSSAKFGAAREGKPCFQGSEYPVPYGHHLDQHQGPEKRTVARIG